VLVTGGSGFIGSNVVELFRSRGATVFADRVELRDAAAVRDAVTAFEPDGIVHCAILNDWNLMHSDRSLAWDAYVGATRNVIDAANDVGAAVVYVSTDWVFDGTHHSSDEAFPPNPVNFYGVLKTASELVVLERARRGVVARVAGVNGTHRARPQAPRAQDPGFGYFVATLVDNLSAGKPFAVWESDSINMVATPSLASECAALFWRALDRGAGGILHCCGGEAVTRMELARQACAVFDLDEDLLRSRPPDPDAVFGLVPYDTSLDARATARVLGTELPSVRELLAAFRRELETGDLQPISAA
jgi:dTDP-4-dehydrorhamnose reductase